VVGNVANLGSSPNDQVKRIDKLAEISCMLHVDIAFASIEDLQGRHTMTSSTDVRHIGGILFAPRGRFN
jgi:hypothetical protein